MIHKLVHIEGSENIVGMMRLYVSQDKLSPIQRDKVSRTVYSIHMNDGDGSTAISGGGRVYNPHPCISIWFIPNTVEPLHYRTWVLLVVKNKRKKCKDTHDVQTEHAIKSWVGVHECTIIVGRSILPWMTWVDVLMPHATNTTNVAWCIEKCSRRINNCDFVAGGTLIYWNISKIVLVVRVELLKKELLDKGGEMWQAELFCKLHHSSGSLRFWIQEIKYIKCSGQWGTCKPCVRVQHVHLWALDSPQPHLCLRPELVNDAVNCCLRCWPLPRLYFQSMQWKSIKNRRLTLSQKRLHGHC